MTKPLRVLVGCECSGIVRRAFLALGHDAWSCDLKPADDRSNRHIIGDIRDYLTPDWDLLAVMHPPCTRLCNSGVRWIDDPTQKAAPNEATAAEKAAWAGLDLDARRVIMQRLLAEGADLFSACWNAPILRIAVENPVMHKHAKALIRNFERHTQSVQPWHFATDEAGPDNVKKRTCLWLKGLPKLKATGTLDGSTARDEVHKASPGPDRAARRSVFYPGIAAAMAAQWGGYAMEQERAA